MPSTHHQATTNFTFTTLLLLFLFTIVLPLATASPTSPLKHTLHGRQEMSAGSQCAAESEGQWNCMTSSFQRCGAGEWSPVQQCALGTQCSPAGLTYEFHVDYVDGYIGAAATSAGDGGRGDMLVVRRWLLLGLSGLVVVFGAGV